VAGSLLRAPFRTVSPLLAGKPPAALAHPRVALAGLALLALVLASGSLLRLTRRLAREERP
jgi:hypothetical protein